MKITIYQIIPELDQDRLIFMPLSYFQKRPGIHHRLLKFMNPYSAEKTEVATLKKSTDIQPQR